MMSLWLLVNDREVEPNMDIIDTVQGAIFNATSIVSATSIVIAIFNATSIVSARTNAQ